MWAQRGFARTGFAGIFHGELADAVLVGDDSVQKVPEHLTPLRE